MSYREPLSYLYDVYYRPERAIAFLCRGWVAVGLAHVTTLIALGWAWMVLWMLSRLLLPLDLRAMMLGWVLASPLAVAAMMLCCVLLKLERSYAISAAITFAWTFCSLVVILPISFLLGAAYSTQLNDWQGAPWVIVLLLLLCGTSLGNIVVIGLVLHRQRRSSALVRWLLTGLAISTGMILCCAPPLRQSSTVVFMPVVIGLAIGLTRPFSYLWAAALSLMLMLVARWRLDARRALACHPVGYDDLCLLPLPGLGRLLHQLCLENVGQGQQWLLRASQHLSQAPVAHSTVARIVQEHEHAHALLFALSTSPEGAVLLAQLAQNSLWLHPLIATYAACAAVPAPGDWTELVEADHGTLAQTHTYPGGDNIATLLLTGAAVLRADRWLTAVNAIISHADAVREEDALGQSVLILKTWTLTLPLTAAEYEPLLAGLRNQLDDVQGWPAALIAAIAEQLLFLRAIEQRRAALGTHAIEQEIVW